MGNTQTKQKQSWKDQIIDIIFLGVIGVIFLILMFSMIGSHGMDSFISSPWSILLTLIGLVLGGIGVMNIVKKKFNKSGGIWHPFGKAGARELHGGAFVGLGIFLILMGMSIGAVHGYELGLEGECKAYFKSSAADFGSYADQFTCMLNNTRILYIGALMFFLYYIVLRGFIPIENSAFILGFTVVITLYMMRRPYIMKLFGTMVEAVFGNIFLVLLLTFLVAGYMFYREGEKEEGREVNVHYH